MRPERDLMLGLPNRSSIQRRQPGLVAWRPPSESETNLHPASKFGAASRIGRLLRIDIVIKDGGAVDLFKNPVDRDVVPRSSHSKNNKDLITVF